MADNKTVFKDLSEARTTIVELIPKMYTAAYNVGYNNGLSEAPPSSSEGYSEGYAAGMAHTALAITDLKLTTSANKTSYTTEETATITNISWKYNKSPTRLTLKQGDTVLASWGDDTDPKPTSFTPDPTITLTRDSADAIKFKINGEWDNPYKDYITDSSKHTESSTPETQITFTLPAVKATKYKLYYGVATFDGNPMYNKVPLDKDLFNQLTCVENEKGVHVDKLTTTKTDTGYMYYCIPSDTSLFSVPTIKNESNSMVTFKTYTGTGDYTDYTVYISPSKGNWSTRTLYVS